METKDQGNFVNTEKCKPLELLDSHTAASNKVRSMQIMRAVQLVVEEHLKHTECKRDFNVFRYSSWLLVIPSMHHQLLCCPDLDAIIKLYFYYFAL